MAHDYLLKIMKDTAFVDESDICFFVDTAWKYADAMQAEAEKRNKEESAQKRKAIREMINADNTFLEKEGQHFDDVEEWQPDWNQAPEWANFLVMSEAGTAYWHTSKPKTSGNGWIRGGLCDLAYMDFYHKGDWRDSLRKRPE